MPQPSDELSPSQFARVHDLFDRTWEIPPAARGEFVRREAQGDELVIATLLEMLANATQALPTGSLDEVRAWLAEQRREPDHAPDLEPPQLRVQATATDELLAKLAKSPKLDLERYSLEGRVGRGGMGAVLRIHDQHLNRRLAVKMPHDTSTPLDADQQRHQRQLLGRFLEEAQVSSQLDHPGVVPVHDLGLDQAGKVWFTMRLVKGRTARDVFADAFQGREGWTQTKALEVVLKVCDTMAYAHEKGVLHRDLKPENVMVGKFGEVYVMDWGLAKVLGQADRHDLRIRPEEPASRDDSPLATARQRDAEQDTGSSVVTMDGHKLGTPSYMSPEQACGDVATLDVRTDVYAIGAMLYQLVTGRPPYVLPGERKSAYRIRDAVVAGPPKRIEELQKGVPAELVAIVDKAMARDRQKRYPDTAALAADLRAFLGSQVVSAYRTGALVELRLWVKRNKPLATSLAAAVLILGVGIVGMTWLANQNAVLAEAESAAKVAATKLAEEKGRTVANFNQLSAVVRLEDALAKQEELWPAWPDKIAALQEWLEKDCAELLKQRPQIEATIAELRSRAMPLTAEQVEADRMAAPEWPAYERQRQLVAALQRAQAIRAGGKLELPELPAALQNADAYTLNKYAWQRVAPERPYGEKQDRTIFGEEAAALVAARAAVEKAPLQFQFLDTLAWAALANGHDDEAKQSAAEAVKRSTKKARATYLGYQREIEAAMAEAPARLASAESMHAELNARVSVRCTWTFADDEESRSAEFLHNALVDVLKGLNAMEAKERADVAQRLRWAQQVEEASIAAFRDRWEDARRAILRADGDTASELYREAKLDLLPQIGLVPIGRNPVTKLWEFYDLRSAWDGKQAATEIVIPTHRENGSIEVKDDTGIVFVLLPGGKVTLGSQKNDPSKPFYDPESQADEELHEVRLSPFFLARHEMTQGQWSRLWTWDAGLRDPIDYRPRQRFAGDRFTLANPVEQVNWDMCDRLMTRHRLVLPTEAQWEYGCRGGTSTPWHVDFEQLGRVANLADAAARETAPDWKDFESWRDGYTWHAPVGTFEANAFGLHDVHGNVCEWCKDIGWGYGAERAGDGLRTSGSPSSRVSRGGAFYNPAGHARSAYRSSSPMSLRDVNLGLRPARLITS